MILWWMVAFLYFLHKNAFHHLYYTETGEPDVLVVFGMIRPKLEPASDVDIAHSPKKIFHGENSYYWHIFSWNICQ